MTELYNPIWDAKKDPKLAEAIGDVILAWTGAEYDQVSMMAAMLNVPHHKAGQLYHQIPNFRARTHALYALIRVSDGFDDLKPIVAKFSRLSKTRNEIVHGAFIREFGGTKLRRVRLDEANDSPNRSVETKAHDISQHAQRVREVCWEFRKVGNSCPAYKAWLGPHREGTAAPRPPEAPK